MTGTYPAIQCQLYKQKTNTYGLYLDPGYPLTEYAEKVKAHVIYQVHCYLITAYNCVET